MPYAENVGILVKMVISMTLEPDNNRTGIHSNANDAIEKLFNKTEKDIAQFWANEWFITRAGQVSLLGSQYNYFFIKPTSSYEEALGISRETVVVISNYPNLEARSLEAYDRICEGIPDVRVERTCYVLISKNPHVKEKIGEFLSNQESQVIIPFSFEDFKQHKGDRQFIRHRFRDSFKSRDLFDFSDPLKKDFYFFGRSEISIEIIDKHKENLNTGLFGLRKTGKTSIIYDIKRKLDKDDAVGVLIDCQDTSFNMRRWNNALYYVSYLVAKETNSELPCEEDFTEVDAGRRFLQSIEAVHKKNKKSILLLFDEIENITFNKSGVEHWRDGLDFVYFWQSIRSAFQSTEKGVFTFCIFGTNAKCIEEPMIKGTDNPIFNVFQPKYIPGFSVMQTREMVRKLGRLMGIKFDETIYARLTEDYGGHPFLIRRVCSMIAQNYPERPVVIDRVKYATIRDRFNRESDYFRMLLEVLIQFYDTEYEMLKYLALGDIKNFKYFADGDYSFVKHLLGYGIIKECDGQYDFQIDAIKVYLQRICKMDKISCSPAEKWSELCVSRGTLEQLLRNMVRKILKIAHKNEEEAKNHVLKKVFAGNKNLQRLTYAELFDSRKATIYFKNLQTLILANWEYFSDYFGKQDLFIQAMTIINKEGRFDAHATIPTDDEMAMIRSAIALIQQGIEKFEKE